MDTQTDRPRYSVWQETASLWHVCLFVTLVNHAKTAEPIEMPFGGLTHVYPGNHALEGDNIGWIHLQPRGVTIGDFGTRVSCAKTAEPIEMPFWWLTYVGPRNGDQDWTNPFEGWQVDDAAFCQITLDTCLQLLQIIWLTIIKPVSYRSLLIITLLWQKCSLIVPC